MKKKIITARIRDDGTVVRVFADGKEKPFPVEPFEVWSDEQIEAAARKDPDNPPLNSSAVGQDAPGSAREDLAILARP